MTADFTRGSARAIVTNDPASELPVGSLLHFEATQFPPLIPAGAGDIREWGHFDGVLLSLHFVQGKRHTIEGSAIMIAPGVALAANHVLAPWHSQLQNGEAVLACCAVASLGLQFWKVKKLTLIPHSVTCSPELSSFCG